MANVLKTNLVDKLTEELKNSDQVVITQYQGMTASEFNELRALLRPFGSKYKVVKNRLAKISFDATGFSELNSYMKGSSAIVYQGMDAAAITKTLFKYAEKNVKLKVKAGRLMGLTADAKTMRAISDLPTREVLMATLLATMNSPLTKLAATLNEPLRSLLAALSAVEKKKVSTVV